MNFEAKYPGECVECGEAIKPGEEIFGDMGYYQHVVCPHPSPAGETCPMCWQVFAANGTCGCES